MPRRWYSMFIVAAAPLALAIAAAAQQVSQAPSSPGAIQKAGITQQDWWLEVTVKARSILIDPATSEQHTVMDAGEPVPSGASGGILSPDGKHIAFIASDPQRVKAGHDFDLFVADIDPAQPSGKSNIIRLTRDQQRPTNPTWLHDSSTLYFLAESENTKGPQVWATFAAADSNQPRMSDGLHPCSQLSVTATGDVMYVQLNRTEHKEQFADLFCALRGKGCETLSKPLVLHDQHISSYAFSPDGNTLAWSGLGSMYLVDLKTGASREIPLHGIHRQLLNHSVYQFAWRPDGRVVAIQCGFLGGIARGPNADPNEPWPRMFAEDKVFFVPVDWSPTAESLTVGEGKDFPSPMVDDPAAEVSPPPADQSKPWWVRGLPMRPLGLTWVSASNAKARLAPES